MIHSRQYTILLLYAPNTKQIPFLRKIISKAKERSVGELTICRDFNVVLERLIDRSTALIVFPKSLGLWLLKKSWMTWMYLHASEHNHTYYSSSKKTHSRIDFFLIDSIPSHMLSHQRSTISRGLTTSRYPWPSTPNITRLPERCGGLKDPNNIIYLTSVLLCN